MSAALLQVRPGVTSHLQLVGAHRQAQKISAAPGLHLYGSDAATVMALPGGGRELGGGLSEAMVRFAARYEYARKVEDVLARRSRLLFLDAALARTMAAEVAGLLSQETGVDPGLDNFTALCGQYLLAPG